jgi:DNA topoisomerase-1
MDERQMGTAMWVIDVLGKLCSGSKREDFNLISRYFRPALRVGGEKGEDEADTVGCCSLRREHMKLLPGSVL